MTVNDYWVAKMQATEASGEETTEEEGATVEARKSGDEPDTEVEEQPTSEDGRAIANPEIVEDEHPQVDENYRPVADPDNHEGEVTTYAPTTDPEHFVGGPDHTDEDVEPDYSAEIPPGEEPTPAETVEPGEAEEGEIIEGTTLAPDLVDVEEQEKRKQEEADSAARAVTNAETARQASAEAVAEQQAAAEDVPAEEGVEPETVGPVGHPEEAELQRERTLEATGAVEDDTYEEDKARATANVPTSANNKQEIRDYLTYEHGIDPDDLKDQTKAELLDWVESLKK